MGIKTGTRHLLAPPTRKREDIDNDIYHRDKEKVITYLTSSVGKILPRFLRTFYS